MYVCYYRVDAWEWRIRYKCLGPVEWRPDVDGKMGKNWILLKQLIFCSLLILVRATKHNKNGRHCQDGLAEYYIAFYFFYLPMASKLDKFFSSPQCDLVGHVLGGASSQVCLVSLGRASSPEEASVSNRAWVYCFFSRWPGLLAPSPFSAGIVVYQMLCSAEGDLFFKVEIICSSGST